MVFFLSLIGFTLEIEKELWRELIIFIKIVINVFLKIGDNLGRRKGDWVCKNCHRANSEMNIKCDRCNYIKER